MHGARAPRRGPRPRAREAPGRDGRPRHRGPRGAARREQGPARVRGPSQFCRLSFFFANNCRSSSEILLKLAKVTGLVLGFIEAERLADKISAGCMIEGYAA